MVLIHTVGDTGDYISVTLIGGNHVQFEYESGKGPQGVTVETAYRCVNPSSRKFRNGLKNTICYPYKWLPLELKSNFL